MGVELTPAQRMLQRVALYRCYTTLRALYENLPPGLSHLPLTAASALVEAFPEVAEAEARLDAQRADNDGAT